MSQVKPEAEKVLPETAAVDAAPKSRARLEWVDIAKGIGMILVIVGHLPPLEHLRAHQIIYWFHMPLFFFLSGYLMKPASDLGKTVARRIRQLGVPYLCYLVVLEAPKYGGLIRGHGGRISALQDIALDFVWGGSRLRGPTLIFWFIPVLLACSIIGYFLLNSKKATRLYVGTAAAIAAAVILAPYLRRVQLPFDLGTVPYALSFLLMGCLFKMVRKDGQSIMSLAGFVVFGVAVALSLSGRLSFDVDMKYCKFDMPLLGLAVGLAGTLVVVLASLPMGFVPMLCKSLGHIGRKSLTIMYLHGLFVLFLFYEVRAFGPTPNVFLLTLRMVALVAIGLGAPLFFDWFFQRFAITRKLFLTG